ncbi:MAG: phosphate ABC transporter permease PstA [Thermoplasmatota archaeon]
MLTLCGAALLLAFIPLAAVLYNVYSMGASALSIHFITSLPRSGFDSSGGIGNAIEGTIVLVLIAAAIGIPVGVGAGMHMSENAGSPIAGTTRFMAEVLTGLPSIVAGIVAYGLGQFSALLGGIALSFLFIPVVAIATQEALNLVPHSQREAALALGMGQATTTLRVVLPAALGGIITGIMLAVARVAGETAPLLFTVGAQNFWPTTINQPTNALPILIYNYAMSPYRIWQAEAWGAAFVLVVMILITNIVVRLLWLRRQRFMRGMA